MVLILVRQTPTFNRSALVLVWRIGLDMVEVGGSNPPGPTIKAAYTLTLCEAVS